MIKWPRDLRLGDYFAAINKYVRMDSTAKRKAREGASMMHNEWWLINLAYLELASREKKEAKDSRKRVERLHGPYLNTNS